MGLEMDDDELNTCYETNNSSPREFMEDEGLKEGRWA